MAELRLQEAARERALRQARRISWRRLHEAQQRYLEWHEFYFWIRSIVEVEGVLPADLILILDERCPGFLGQHPIDRLSSPRACLALWDWIDQSSFGAAQSEGWFDAIEFFAVRHPRYQRAQAGWLHLIDTWRAQKPGRYPNLREWLVLAMECEPPAFASPVAEAAWTALRLVSAERLEDAVNAYLDWEAFAYWVRTPIEEGVDALPPNVEIAVDQRCPGFLDLESHRRAADSTLDDSVWARLMAWGQAHRFATARAEGWLDAVVLCASLHPRGQRLADYWLWFDGNWTSGGNYPDFEEWCASADVFVEDESPQ